MSEVKIAKLAARLRRLDLDRVPTVPNLNVPTLSRVKNVHDADTVTVVICLGTSPLCLRIRVEHIDSPEITLKGGTRQLEKSAGLLVRDYVASLLLNQSAEGGLSGAKGRKLDESPGPALTKVVLTGIDKYGGRYLGDLFLPDGTPLSQHLISRRLVRPYEGGTKQPWTDAELNFIIESLSRS